MSTGARIRQVREVLMSTQLCLEDVWIAYYAMGGAASRFELEACLAGVLTLDGGECEVLVEATNTRLAQNHIGMRIADCTDSSFRTLLWHAEHEMGAVGAFLLTPQEQERERVEAVIRTGLLDTAPEDRFDRISRQVSDHFRVGAAMITVIDDRRCFGKSVIGPLRREVSRAVSLSDLALRRARPTVIHDTTTDYQCRDTPFVLGDPHLRFFAGHPLRGPRGWMIGTLCIADQTPRIFTADDGRILRAFAQRVEDEINGPRILPEL